MEISFNLFACYGFYLSFFISLITCFIFKSRKSNKSHILTNTEKTICSVFTILALAIISLLLTKFIHGNELKTVITAQIILSTLFGFLLSTFSASVFSFIKNRIYSNKIYNNRYGFFAFFILTLKLVLSSPNSVDNWSAWSYAVNYSMGFGSRFFIGSVLNLFFPNYISNSVAYGFYFTFSILLIVIVSWFINCIVKTANPANKLGLLFLIGCFFCCPASIDSMFNGANFGRLDMYVLLVSLCAVISFVKIKSVVWKYIILTILGCLCNLIYHGFMFMYFPLFIIIMIYDALLDGIVNKAKLFMAICVAFIICCSFFSMQFCSFVIFENAEEMAATMNGRTNLPITVDALDYEYFKSIFYSYKTFVPKYIAYEQPREKLLLVTVFMFPILITFVQLFKNAFNNSKLVIYKNPLFYSLLSMLFIIPQFVFNIDWGRWVTPVVINSFFIVLYFVFKKDQSMLNAVNRLSIFVKAHPTLAFSSLIFLMLFDALLARAISSDAAKIIDRFYLIIGFIIH